MRSRSATPAPASAGSISQVPGNIQMGQHWLNVKLEKTVIRVPFRILTKEEEERCRKNYKDISRQVKDAFKPPKK